MKTTTHTNPIIIPIILPPIITLLPTPPLTSIPLTPLLPLTPLPIPIPAIPAFTSPFINATLFHPLKLPHPNSTISLTIQPLSQAHIVSANPIPVYVTNFFAPRVAPLIIRLS
ncbi:PTS sugar transporter subunit IIC, partial [Staphylococcus hominis]|uniref:PTS sugar transporter subunit IIC n=1 Tax=Staphylococcus hominis TaxID=1290 RepID=UPI00370973C7